MELYRIYIYIPLSLSSVSATMPEEGLRLCSSPAG